MESEYSPTLFSKISWEFCVKYRYIYLSINKFGKYNSVFFTVELHTTVQRWHLFLFVPPLFHANFMTLSPNGPGPQTSSTAEARLANNNTSHQPHLPCYNSNQRRPLKSPDSQTLAIVTAAQWSGFSVIFRPLITWSPVHVAGLVHVDIKHQPPTPILKSRTTLCNIFMYACSVSSTAILPPHKCCMEMGRESFAHLWLGH